MKRKFISAILFGALLVAPASVFVSCSDYDDDIKSLQGQTDALKTQLAEQEAALEAALAQHKADFEAAKVAAAEAMQAAQAAQAQGDKALAEAQAAKADAALARQAAAEAQAAAIAEAQKLVNALRQEIEDKGYATQASLDAAVARIVACEEELQKLKNIPTEVGDLQVKVNEHASAIEALKTQMAAVEAYKALIDANAASIKALEGKSAEADKAIKDLQETVKGLATQAGLNEAVKDLNDRIDKLADQVASINAQLVTLQTSKLRALVFMPNLYADGIEAAEYGYLRYKAQDGSQHANGHNKARREVMFPAPDGDQATQYAPVAADSHFFPVVNVEYHLNPSSAVIKDGQLSFVSRDVEVISRATSRTNPEVVSFSQSNGVLTVGMQAVGNEISNDPKKACIFALQANIKNGTQDTTITSDYAMLYGSTLTPKAIAFINNNYGGKTCTGATILNNELYDDPVVALQNDPAILLEYNEQGQDLKGILETHYVWNTQTKKAVDHGKWAYGEEAAYGLHYEYTLINYVVKGNETSDSRYANLKDGVISANAVNADGTPNESVQDESSIGREPLVKVMVKDEAGNVVLYGYIKVQIVREIGSKVLEETAAETSVDYCNAKKVLEVEWSDISAKVLSKLGMSNEEFHALYTLQGVLTPGVAEDTIDAYQFIPEGSPVVDGVKFKQATGTEVVGEVVEIAEKDGTRTSKITWTLAPEEQAAIYESSATHSKTIYVAYVRRNVATDHAPLYLPLTIKFKDREGAKAMESKKLETYWKWGADKQPGINVPQPYDNGNTRNVAVNIHQVFEGATPRTQIVFPTAYANDIRAGRYAFYFLNSSTPDGQYNIVAANGDKILHKFTTASYAHSAANEVSYAIGAATENAGVWTLRGAYANNKVYLNTVAPSNEIATIDQSTGEITYYRPIGQPYTAAGQAPWYKLLNAYGTNNLAEPQAFLKVGMVVWNECGVARAITDDDNLRIFNEYLLRPINVNPNDSGTFVDAKANYSEVKLLDLLDFSDWRFAKFVDLQNRKFTNAWLFGFYRVLKCEVDLPEIQTNINQATPSTFVKLSGVAPYVDVDYVPGSATATLNGVPNVFAGISSYATEAQGTQATYETIRDKYFGVLKYKNNGNPIGYFVDPTTKQVLLDGNGDEVHNVLRVPVDITYDWGKLARVWVDIKIEPSGATATNRK